jgi:hypothetical protein
VRRAAYQVLSRQKLQSERKDRKVFELLMQAEPWTSEASTNLGS